MQNFVTIDAGKLGSQVGHGRVGLRALMRRSHMTKFGFSLLAVLTLTACTTAWTNEANAADRAVTTRGGGVATVVDTYTHFPGSYRGCWIKSRVVVDQWGQRYVGPACVPQPRGCMCYLANLRPILF